MSKSEIRTPRGIALQIAHGLLAMLVAGCERIELAGSIRRLCADVGDIEIVCVPQRVPLTMGLFGAMNGATVSLLDDQLQKIYATGTWSIAVDKNKNGKEYKLDGEKLKKLRHTDSGLTADLFIVTPRTWGALFSIRTGPSAYSEWLVSQALRQHKFEERGLLHGHSPQFKTDPKTGDVKRLPCPRGDTCSLIIPTPEEQDFFAALGIEYVAPELRGVKP